tara:strand:+ start:632 stop:1729 length:1098 start_codon:yes stop_codon:yes gene_type:complete
MKSDNFPKQIRNYAVASFLVPLIAINACLFLYKFIGNMVIKTYPGINWEKPGNTYSWNEYTLLNSKKELYTFTNCPKYNGTIFLNYTDNQALKTIEMYSSQEEESFKLITKLIANNKIKSVIFKKEKTLDDNCVKNHQFLYSLLKNFSWVETILIKTVKNNPVGFVKIKNPYLYGEVSISRTARYFPATWIFKSLIILSSFLLFLYWKNNLNLFNELENKNILVKSSKKFFYFGIFSCIFLALHATFLGLDFDSKLFTKIRRLIIILFILFEILAQIYLTKNLFKFREELKKYIHPLILKIKIIFVVIVFFTTCIAFTILAFGDPSVMFKHSLEWNYFALLLVYYLLSRLLWRNTKTQVHTPEGV